MLRLYTTYVLLRKRVRVMTDIESGRFIPTNNRDFCGYTGTQH